MNIKRLWTSGEACEITGASRRNINYWVQTGIIRPSATKPGTRRWYFFTFDDLIRLRTVVELRDRDASLQHIRETLRALHDLNDDPLRECRLVVFGRAVHIFDPKDQILRRVLDGQVAYKDLVLEAIAKHVEDTIILHPDLGREDVITRGLHVDQVGKRSA